VERLELLAGARERDAAIGEDPIDIEEEETDPCEPGLDPDVPIGILTGMMMLGGGMQRRKLRDE
jgi:hypothetical protein